MADQVRIAVVGAGMAGMAAAYELARTPGIAVSLFEASTRLGGTVETVTLPSDTGEPFIIECGPDSWVSEKPAGRELAIELGLGDQIIYSNDARRRTYLARFGAVHRGELIPMPDGMRMMVPTRWAPVLESPLFTWQARLAYLREPGRAEEFKQYALERSAATGSEDESVGSFVRRHFGDEATATIAGPLLAGVFGGDIETLSAQAVLAPFVRMEREQGSLITAVMQRGARRVAGHDGQGSAEPIFTTLRTGLQTLVERIAATLPAQSIHLGCRVIAMRKDGEHGWSLHIARQRQQELKNERGLANEPEQAFAGVILATPAAFTRELLTPLDAEAGALLAIETTSAIVVALAYEQEAAARLRIPRGFGFLAPPSQALGTEPRLLAGTFMDQKFPHRAPQGAVLLRGFFGGRVAPRLLDWSDPAIAEAACAFFSRLLGPLPKATHTVVRRWPHSLPQYAVGHLARMQALQGRIDRMRGLRLTGNAYPGVGLPNLVEHGRSAARALVASLATQCVVSLDKN